MCNHARVCDAQEAGSADDTTRIHMTAHTHTQTYAGERRTDKAVRVLLERQARVATANVEALARLLHVLDDFLHLRDRRGLLVLRRFDRYRAACAAVGEVWPQVLTPLHALRGPRIRLLQLRARGAHGKHWVRRRRRWPWRWWPRRGRVSRLLSLRLCGCVSYTWHGAVRAHPCFLLALLLRSEFHVFCNERLDDG